MKKLAALAVFASACNLLLLAISMAAGHTMPLYVIGMIAAYRPIHCGAEAKNYNIVLLDIRRKLYCNLTGMDGHAVFAGWSPDGTRVAVEAGGTVYIADSHMNPIFRFPQAYSPVWSPNGLLAFAALDGDIYTVDQNGENLHNATNSEIAVAQPSWSPDGTQIVFVCGQDVCVVQADGQNLEQLTSGDLPAATPQWYHRGREILYTSSPGAYLISATGESPRPFYTSQHVFAGPFVSLDGERAAFITPDSMGGIGIAIANGDPAAEQLISLGIYRAPGKVAWLEDGRQLAISLGSEVYLVNLASGSAHLLCDRCTEPAWMPAFAF